MAIQTRSEETGLRFFETLEEAFAYIKEDDTVWKMSIRFPNGESLRLVKEGDDTWVNRSLTSMEHGA